MKVSKSFDFQAYIARGLAKSYAEEHARRIKEGIKRKKNASK